MKLVLLSSVGLLFSLMLPAAAQDSQSPAGVEIRKVDEGLSVKRVFSRLWAKLRAYVPKPGMRQAATKRTQIAGVRGAESTGSQLQPYWKGDRTADPSYVEQVEAFYAAIELADGGRLQAAAKAFSAFAAAYPDSDLSPHAQFALGLLYIELGNEQQGVKALRTFARSYPSHPLAADAQQMIEQLQAGLVSRPLKNCFQHPLGPRLYGCFMPWPSGTSGESRSAAVIASSSRIVARFIGFPSTGLSGGSRALCGLKTYTSMAIESALKR